MNKKGYDIDVMYGDILQILFASCERVVGLFSVANWPQNV